MNIRLLPMTQAMCRAYFHEFANDPDVFAAGQPFSEYLYTPEKADVYWQKNQAADRVHLVILMGNEPIGEVILKNIDRIGRHCTLSIHMKNDSVKNRGFGTEAERLAIIYAIEKLELKTIFADTLINNKRSQHVLEKNGFQKIGRDSQYFYYKYAVE